MARRAIRLREQRFGGRVVQVDVEIVGEQELDEPQRILVARPLTNATRAAVVVPLHVFATEVTRVRGELRHDLLALNARRDVPVRTERHRLHGIAEHRSDPAFVFRADDNLHGQSLLPAVVGIQAEGGHVDVHVA